jgi:hypothetical protein
LPGIAKMAKGSLRQRRVVTPDGARRATRQIIVDAVIAARRAIAVDV